MAFISETDQTREVDGYDGTTITELLRLESEFSKLKVSPFHFRMFPPISHDPTTFLNFAFRAPENKKKTGIIFTSF